MILELTSKYSHEDILIGVYSAENDILSDIHALPHLYLGETRMTFHKESQLHAFLKESERSKVLFTDIALGRNFDPDAAVLYFSSGRSDYLKDSDEIIVYDERCTLSSDDKRYFIPDNTVIDEKEAFLVFERNDTHKRKRDPLFNELTSAEEIRNRYLSKQKRLKSIFAVNGDTILDFDLHEKGNGPHGLIAGSTGSGKSELIISLLLGACIINSPEYLNIIMIDYKGGGLEESLSFNGRLIPHVVASITNLEEDTFERLITGIRKECRRRQELFRKLSKLSASSIMSIDDYLNGGYQKYGLDSVAHLLIVVDEFAELKKENPEVIRELVSFSRIGRSLGLHLILATQRPNGVIDDEIWSNSRFKIALKVFSEKDSQDIIHERSAAFLSDPGSFYLAYDTSLLECKAIYSKRDIADHDPKSVAICDSTLHEIARRTRFEGAGKREAEYLCEQMIKTADELGLKGGNISFRKPLSKTIAELKNMYGCLAYGEADDYLNAEKYPVTVDLDEDMLICSLRKDELLYLLEFLKDKKIVLIAKNTHDNIKDSLSYNDKDGIEHLFYRLSKEDRDIYLVIEDVSAFIAYDQSYLERLLALLARKRKARFYFISGKPELNFRFISSFKQRLFIMPQQKQDILAFFGSTAELKGSSFFMKDKPVPFVPFRKTETGTDNSDPYLLAMPALICRKQTDERKLIGLDIVSREEVYLDKTEHLTIRSYDEKQLNRLYEDYDNTDLDVYDSRFSSREDGAILWIGEGISSQRMFYCDRKEELDDGTALLYHRGRSRVIRMINHE